MKRIFIFAFTLLLSILLALPAFASGAPEAGEGESFSGSNSVTVYNEIYNDPVTYLGSNVSYSAFTGAGEGLKGVLLDFLGEWQTVVVEHSYQTSDGSVVVVHDTQPDYAWLCAAALLCLMIFCLFRLGGSILCKI